jgi:hypothetical protein
MLAYTLQRYRDLIEDENEDRRNVMLGTRWASASPGRSFEPFYCSLRPMPQRQSATRPELTRDALAGWW